jgi:hypothetical protein
LIADILGIYQSANSCIADVLGIYQDANSLVVGGLDICQGVTGFVKAVIRTSIAPSWAILQSAIPSTALPSTTLVEVETARSCRMPRSGGG